MRYSFDPRFVSCNNAFLVTGKAQDEELDKKNRKLLKQNKTGHWEVKEDRINKGDLMFLILPDQIAKDGYPRKLYGGKVNHVEYSLADGVVFSVDKFFYLETIYSHLKQFLLGKVPAQGNHVLGVWSGPINLDAFGLFENLGGYQFESAEGKKRLAMHVVIERNAYLARRKKDLVLKKNGKLSCEACGFDFAGFYGEIGQRFCEIHHRVPLSKSRETVTTLNDLAVLCANCHRVIHRTHPMITVEQLAEIVANKD
ncbi:HNH endonuclease [uncultured Paenalcaligenes sp.]|uniref:HNH endonuclease n=1 Tax=uncultured Paenalcaligenes sp. TaxID=1588925 RepID=UPI0026097163|nr:HNH endonuclease [uncultured Paenalcaligenes sp.]